MNELCGPIKTFPLRTVLTLTTGRLVTVPDEDGGNGIGQLYKLLNHMTGDNLFTHQLPRASKECIPWMVRWHPELEPTLACGDKLDGWLEHAPSPQEAIRMWVTELRMLFPAILNEYRVGRIPQDDHEVKDPYDELVQMRGTDEGIIIL